MGTSKSYGGPTDAASQLLPSWAVNPDPSAPITGGDAANPSNGTDGPGQENDAGVDGAAGNVQAAPGPVVQPSRTERPWASAKAQLGKVVVAGGTRQSFQSAARAYVRARGGSSGAAKASRAGRSATARLGSFLSGIAADGIRPTLERFDLATVVGRDAQQVLTAISDAIAPDGASREEAIARRATNDVLKELYEKYAVASEGFAKLEAMAADDIRKALEASIATYIYYCWLEELGAKIEEKSVSGVEAERLERDMKAYVRDVVRLDLKDVDVLTVDWAGDAGGKVIEKLYAEAYQVLGGSA